MSDESRDKPEPPLVLKVEERNVPLVQLVATQPRYLRPILFCIPFFETIGWCIVFLGTQVIATILAALIVLVVYAVEAPDANKYLKEQWDGFREAMSPESSSGELQGSNGEGIGRALAYGMLAAQVASVGLILLVFPRRIGRDWKRQIAVRTPSAVHVLLVLLVVPGFMILSGGFQELLQKLTGLAPKAGGKEIKLIFGSFPWYLTFLAIALGPGFTEEMWCRGLLGRRLSARYGLWAGVIITSALFGILHGDPAHAMIAAVMGLYLHFVYLAARSIWVSILLHASNNGLSVLATFTTALDQFDSDSHETTSAIYIAASVLVLLASFLLWTSRSRVVPSQFEEGPPKWHPEYPGISAPPPLSGIRLERGKVNPIACICLILSFAILMVLLVW